MPIPLIVWGALAVTGAVTAGGYSFGREVGQGVKNITPVAVGALAVYAAYQVAKK